MNPERFEIQGKHIAWWLLGLVFVGVTLLCYKAWTYVEPFSLPVFTAALFACFLNKWCTVLTVKLKCSRVLASATVTLGLLFTFVLPFSISSFSISSQAIEGVHVIMDEERRAEGKDMLVEKMHSFVEEYPWSKTVMNKVIDTVDAVDTDQSVLVGYLSFNGIVKGVGGKVTSMLTSLLSRGLGFFGQMFITHVALFIFLLKGEEYMLRIVGALPFDKERKRGALSDVSRGITALFNSMLVTGLVQGGVGALVIGVYCIMYAHISILLFVFIAFLMVFFSAIPLAGASIGVITYAVIALIHKHYVFAGLMVVTAAFIAISDNYIKPKIMGSAVEVKPVLLLLFMLGGVAVDGPIGVLSGPFLIILLTIIWREFGDKFDEFKQDLKNRMKTPEVVVGMPEKRIN